MLLRRCDSMRAYTRHERCLKTRVCFTRSGRLFLRARKRITLSHDVRKIRGEARLPRDIRNGSGGSADRWRRGRICVGCERTHHRTLMVAAYELIYLSEWQYHGEFTLRARQISPEPSCVSFSRLYGRIIDTRDRRENGTAWHAKWGTRGREKSERQSYPRIYRVS